MIHWIEIMQPTFIGELFVAAVAKPLDSDLT